jgi:hypothetical protein
VLFEFIDICISDKTFYFSFDHNIKGRMDG